MKANFAQTYLPAHALLRGLILCAALAVAWPSMAQQPRAGSEQAASVQALPAVDVYKSPQCGCCKFWAEHLQKNGFTVTLHDVNDIPATRKKLGMPNRYGSCHTAKVGQYLVEGHVPAADIKKLLEKKPKAIGLAVPAMPPGSPGMESDEPVPYDTLLVGKDGKAKVFARH
ncbi:MAG: DUF411 domain-containing protein [Gallionella sp.]